VLATVAIGIGIYAYSLQRRIIDAQRGEIVQQRAQSQDAKRVLAETLLRQIDSAIAEMKREFGPDVFSDRRSPDLIGPRGAETRGNAWARALASNDGPASDDERIRLARTLNLDPRAALALAGPIANLEAIEYLQRSLREIATNHISSLSGPPELRFVRPTCGTMPPASLRAHRSRGGLCPKKQGVGDCIL
jgi:hypothetical protein